ncbi:MAG: DNA-formamidopyrimidine glycosylase family protein [Actinomycetota bacterium]
MPECLEAEIWRRDLLALIGRRIDRVEFDDRVADPALAAVEGTTIEGVRRHGKVVLVDTSGPVIGVRFGMTGRVVVDGASSIDALAYSSRRDDPAWDRVVVWADGSETPALRMNDPRRLGRIETDPDLRGLGPDALGIGLDELRARLRGRTAATKATLMNQSVVAGLGNLCVDEVLFAAGIAPTVAAGSLSAAETRRLQRALVTRLPAMLRAGGSTHGVLDPSRRAERGRCPRRGCVGALRVIRIGGRTTVYCPEHQLA